MPLYYCFHSISQIQTQSIFITSVPFSWSGQWDKSLSSRLSRSWLHGAHPVLCKLCLGPAVIRTASVCRTSLHPQQCGCPPSRKPPAQVSSKRFWHKFFPWLFESIRSCFLCRFYTPHAPDEVMTSGKRKWGQCQFLLSGVDFSPASSCLCLAPVSSEGDSGNP